MKRGSKTRLKEIKKIKKGGAESMSFLSCGCVECGTGHKVERNIKKMKEVPSPCHFCHDVFVRNAGHGHNYE
jgi:hypothetical protein